MDYGYSTFLGRQVQARDLDYGHPAQLQVVCPCCKEPVHKGVRSSSRGATHYLSHYAAENPELQRCEFRTGAETVPPGAEAFGGQGRHQKLATFADVLREELDQNTAMRHVPRIREELLGLGSLTAVLRSLRIRIERHRREAKGSWRDSTNHICREFLMLRDKGKFAVTTSGGLTEDRRRTRRALDLFDQLLTVPGRDAFDLVAAHAVAVEVIKGHGEIREHGRCITPGRGDVCVMFEMMLQDRARRRAHRIFEQAEQGPSTLNPDVADRKWAALTTNDWFKNVVEATVFQLFYDLDETRLEMRRGEVLRYDGGRSREPAFVADAGPTPASGYAPHFA